MAEGAFDYTHQELDREVASVSGRYVLTKEVRLPFRGREILYVTGYAVFDTSCCGDGGCGYAQVPGFILDWKYKIDDAGLPISRTERIQDGATKREVQRVIEKREPVNQVNFG